ncbi:MAG TPA: MFS transporter [Candidatus Sulfotelmatobacter sp.]|nr:MFS transporter [Candidatus Sulfotelmatobacter sp.]
MPAREIRDQDAGADSSTRALTYAAYVAFVPVGIVTVILGPMLPMLSARWSLNYSQAGALFTAQYLASTCAVAFSGVLSSRWGYRFAIKIGLVVMAGGVIFLLSGPRLLGILCVFAYGAGQGIAVPAANLLVSEANPRRRSATLNLLNFFWSSGAVACPFLVAAAVKTHHIQLFLLLVGLFSIAVALGIALMPTRMVQSASPVGVATSKMAQGSLWRRPAFLILAALFFMYVGTENAFGGWVASYSRSLGSIAPAVSLMTASFFYAALMLGRILAPLVLRRVHEVRLAQAGLLLACTGSAGLLFSRELPGVVASAVATGLGLSSVYPITISLLSHQFGSASSRIGSVMFTLSNVGGGLMPWTVGVSANRFGALRVGMCVPVLGCAAMYAFFLRKWKHSSDEMVE